MSTSNISSTASMALPVGTRLGEFEVTGVVGEGGFGIVYSAHDSTLDRIVAIKEYLPTAFALRTPEGAVQVKNEEHRPTFTAGLSSFINEAKMLARFSHPALVEVFRFWEGNGSAYMAMRYYRGPTLRDILRGTPEVITEDWLRETLDPVLLALEVLHNEKCYHRDVAPDNVLVLPNGRSVLMDFGAARRIIGGMTQALTTVLKPGYAPVEQYSDDGTLKQGAWTDVYAVGGLLYHAMTGKVPVQAISRMISDPLKPVAQASGGRFSASLCEAVTRAMAVMPADRFQTIRELRQALGWESVVAVPSAPKVPRPILALRDDDPATVILPRHDAEHTQKTEAVTLSLQAPVQDPSSRTEIFANETHAGVLPASWDQNDVPTVVQGRPDASGAQAPAQPISVDAGHGAVEDDPLKTLITTSPVASVPEPLYEPTVVIPMASPTSAPVMAAVVVPEPSPLPSAAPTMAPLPGEPAAPLKPKSKSKSNAMMIWVIGYVVAALLAVAGVFVLLRPSPSPVSPAPAPAVAPPVSQPAPETAAAPAPPPPVPAKPASRLPEVPGAAAPGPAESPANANSGAADAAAKADAPKPPPAANGFVRFELKNGWGTIWVDGVQKGTSPPLVSLELAPGTHEVEVRNPAVAGVKRSVEVLPGKTFVLRFAFATP
jgi:non-specific serine/threonine protein kinase